MPSTIKEMIQELSDKGKIELIETNELDDGSFEDVYEIQSDDDGLMTIKVYRAK